MELDAVSKMQPALLQDATSWWWGSLTILYRSHLSLCQIFTQTHSGQLLQLENWGAEPLEGVEVKADILAAIRHGKASLSLCCALKDNPRVRIWSVGHSLEGFALAKQGTFRH